MKKTRGFLVESCGKTRPVFLYLLVFTEREYYKKKEERAAMEVPNKTIICYERWDYEALERIRALDIRPVEVKASLNKIKLHPNEDGRVMVRYATEKGDSKGRVYGSLVAPKDDWPGIYWPQGDSL